MTKEGGAKDSLLAAGMEDFKADGLGIPAEHRSSRRYSSTLWLAGSGELVFASAARRG
jgi:hypothetical protein